MRLRLTLLAGKLLDLSIGDDPDGDDYDEPQSFGFHGGSSCTTELGETMLDTADRER